MRGCRVELSEIEYHLTKQFDGVAVAAEVVHLKGQHDGRLIAFVSTDPGVDVGSQGLILQPKLRLIRAQVALQELAKVLPAYMVPSVLLPVRRLPKTASDKIDRKLLRQAAAELTGEDLIAYSTSNHEEIQMPETSDEHLMSGLWAEVLQVSLGIIGSKSNFFDLGSDSGTAMRLVSAARSKKRALTVQKIFKSLVLSDLTREWPSVSAEREYKQARSPFSLLDVSNTCDFLTEHICKPFDISIADIVDVLPATFHQVWEIQDNSTCLVFEFESAIDLDRLLKSWNQVVEMHEILRTVLIPHNSGYLQVVLKKLVYDIEILSTEGTSQNLIERNFRADPPAPGTALLSIMAVKTRDYTVLSLRPSHALYDGWCIGEFWKDWGTAYAGAKVPERVQFRDFLYATAKAGQNVSYDYWRNLLVGSVPTHLREPRIHDSTSTQERRVRAVRVIALASIPESCTSATFIKAAWALTLARRFSTLDIVMMQLTSGRRSGQGGHEDAIGPCMSYFPARVTIQAHWRALDIFPFIQNQDVESMPFENVQLHDLISNCTDWPLDMSQYLGSILFHESDQWVNCLKIQDREYPVTYHWTGYTPKGVDLYTSIDGLELN